MIPIFKKEIRTFFGSLTGVMAIIVFLLLMGLLLFVFPDTSILAFGYATLDNFFSLAPFVLLLLIPAITMRSLADEFRQGTWEILATRPLSAANIVVGKYFGALLVAILALVPTLTYIITIKLLSVDHQIDGGAIAGSYIGLLSLVALFTAVGIFCSAVSSNAMVGFLLAALGCYLLFSGFDAVSRIPVLAGGLDYYIQQLGADAHYRSLSRGVLQASDLAYFAITSLLFLFLTQRLLLRKNR